MTEKEVKESTGGGTGVDEKTVEIMKTPDPKQDTGGGGGVDEKVPTMQNNPYYTEPTNEGQMPDITQP